MTSAADEAVRLPQAALRWLDAVGRDLAGAADAGRAAMAWEAAIVRLHGVALEAMRRSIGAPTAAGALPPRWQTARVVARKTVARGRATIVAMGLRRQRVASKSRPRVIVLPRESNHLHALRPTVAAMTAAGLDVVYVAPTVALSARLAHERLPVVILRRHAAALAGGLAGEARMAIDPVIRRAIQSGPALSLWGRDHADAVRAALLEAGPGVFADVARLHCDLVEAFDAVRPDAVVCGNDATLEGRLAALVAARRVVPSISLQHGTISAANPLTARFVVTRFLTYGPAGAEALASMGAPADRIEPVGSPYVDALGRQANIFEDPRPALGMDTERPCVLLALSGAGHTVSAAQHLMAVEQFYRASQAVPEAHFVAKLHPKDRGEAHAAAAQRLPDARVTVVNTPKGAKGEDIFAFLRVSAALVTISSSAANDALRMGVPVVALDPLGEAPDAEFLRAGAAYLAGDATELASLLTQLVAGMGAAAQEARAASFLSRMFMGADGRSAERVVGIVERLIAARPHAR